MRFAAALLLVLAAGIAPAAAGRIIDCDAYSAGPEVAVIDGKRCAFATAACSRATVDKDGLPVTRLSDDRVPGDLICSAEAACRGPDACYEDTSPDGIACFHARAVYETIKAAGKLESLQCAPGVPISRAPGGKFVPVSLTPAH